MILNLCSWNINFLLPNQTICMFVCFFVISWFSSLLVVWALSLTALFFLVSLLFVCLSKLYVCMFELVSWNQPHYWNYIQDIISIFRPLFQHSNIVVTFRTSFQPSGQRFNVQDFCNDRDFVLTFRTSFQCLGHRFNVQDIFQYSRHCYKVRDIVSMFKTSFQCSGHHFNVQDIISMFKTSFQPLRHCYKVQDIVSMFKTSFHFSGQWLNVQDIVSTFKT